MQPYFHWINEPAEWRRDSDGLTVVTNKHTDFWRHTWYGFERFSGHLYAAEVAGDFTLQAKICADFTTLYDQAGLMMMADEQTWLKAGIEFNDDAPAIGSVLTLTHSDWATGLFPGAVLNVTLPSGRSTVKSVPSAFAAQLPSACSTCAVTAVSVSALKLK